MQHNKFQPALIVLAVLLFIPLAWMLLYFAGLLHGNVKNWGHQEFAGKSVALIAPAAEMESHFADCRHFITYGPGGVPVFNSVAYFGGRYELTMQVQVAIDSPTAGRIAGTPRFYLNEVSEVTVSPTGQVGAGYSENHKFGMAEWSQVFNANGDFSVIGITIDPTPVKGFANYAGASRPSN